MKLKLECPFNPKDLTNTCHKCADNPEKCTIGIMNCPWIHEIISCKDITEEHWEIFIRNNLDLESLFGR